MMRQSDGDSMKTSPFLPSVLDSGGLSKDGYSAIERSVANGIDLISVGDILRNGFVTPPYTVSGDIRLNACDGVTDLVAGKTSDVLPLMDDKDYVDTYHGMLCGVMRSVCEKHRSPWLLQSGGKDSVSLAIALAAESPGSNCVTYCGGREEDEVASARYVANRLGLHHDVIQGDCSRAYRNYLARVQDMPLITGDAALLSYFDIMGFLSSSQCDAVIDGIGSDIYFGYACSQRQHWERHLAIGLPGIDMLYQVPGVRKSFHACYLLSTLAMTETQRIFPASRFSDREADSIMGRNISSSSRARLEGVVQQNSAAKRSYRDFLLTLKEIGGAAAKGSYAAAAYDVPVIFPFMDRGIVDWVITQLPTGLRYEPNSAVNKVIVRQHIYRHLGHLPYVQKKGCFRFDLTSFATTHFDMLADMASSHHCDVLPGAKRWLTRHRKDMSNKYFASKFYLLAILLPWIASRV